MSSETLTQPPQGRHKKHLFRTACGALLWLACLVKLFLFDFDVFLIDTYAPNLRWLLSYKAAFYFAIFALSLWVAHVTSGWRTWCYIVAFPFVALWRGFLLAIRHWPFLLALSPIIIDAIRGLPYSAPMHAIGVLGVLGVLLADHPLIIRISIGFLAIFLVWHLVQRVQKSVRKSLFARLAQTLRKTTDSAVSHVFQEVSSAPSTESNEKAVQKSSNALTNAYFAHSLAAGISRRVNEAARGNAFTAYLLLSWVYTFVLTVLLYSFAYWGVSRLDPSEFINGANASFWRFVHLSVGVLATAGGGTVQAVGPMSSFISATELFLIPVIGVVFVTSLFSMARDAYRQDAADFCAAVEQLAAAVEVRLRDAYQITVSELESKLESDNGQLVVFFRRVRGD